MAIDPKQLAAHIEDYNDVTGNKIKRFVCPITLQQCEEHELINGHILNKGLRSASRMTVIQYKDVDHFYGSTVEPALIRFLNSKGKELNDLLRESDEIKVHFPDGSEVSAFVPGPRSASKAAEKFPAVTLRHQDHPDVQLYLRTSKDDPRLSGPVDLSRMTKYFPAHWVAAMVKAGYLTMFKLFGYSMVFSPFGDSIRRDLNRYYAERGRRDDAHLYFSRYRRSIQLLLRQDYNGAGLTSLPNSTLSDHELWLSKTPAGTVFAATCLFLINDITAVITLPMADSSGDVEIAVDFYERLMADPESVPRTMHRARLRDGALVVEERPLPISTLPDPNAS